MRSSKHGLPPVSDALSAACAGGSSRPGSEFLGRHERTDGRLDLPIAESVLKRVVGKRVGDRRHDDPLVQRQYAVSDFTAGRVTESRNPYGP